MTSLVTGYSSEEEEDQNSGGKGSLPSKNGKGLEKRQKDVNYDDVNMEMSDSDKEDKSKSGGGGESSEWRAPSKNISVEEEDSKSSHKKKKKKRSKSSEEEEEEEEGTSSRKDDERHRSSGRRRRGDERSDRHRRKHRRRSREHRRSRSRDRSRSNRGEDNETERMSKHSRKLKALGLVAGNEETSAPETASTSGHLMKDGPVKKVIQAQVAQVKQMTGVELPKYYNPSAINPLRYAEQIKKRKMLWSKPGGGNEDKSEKKKEVETRVPVRNESVGASYNNWESTNFGNSQANEKFRRLMGIKNASATTSSTGSEAPGDTKKMFQDLDKQYEKARITTHTARGLGLGFSNPLIPSGSMEDHSKAPRK